MYGYIIYMNYETIALEAILYASKSPAIRLIRNVTYFQQCGFFVVAIATISWERYTLVSLIYNIR